MSRACRYEKQGASGHTVDSGPLSRGVAETLKQKLMRLAAVSFEPVRVTPILAAARVECCVDTYVRHVYACLQELITVSSGTQRRY